MLVKLLNTYENFEPTVCLDEPKTPIGVRTWPERSRCSITEMPDQRARGIKRYEKQNGRKRNGAPR
jgi:hypothetical protein